jgi:prophage antirepressor-like protein
MAKIFETLKNNYIKFENNKINIIINNDNKIWFNASEIANAVGYKSSKKSNKK